MAICELGGHTLPSAFSPKHLNWCCPDCLEVFHLNRNEIAHQAELGRQFTLDNRRSPYRFVPYYGLTLAFAAFLLVFFL